MVSTQYAKEWFQSASLRHGNPLKMVSVLSLYNIDLHSSFFIRIVFSWEGRHIYFITSKNYACGLSFWTYRGWIRVTVLPFQLISKLRNKVVLGLATSINIFYKILFEKVGEITLCATLIYSLCLILLLFTLLIGSIDRKQGLIEY